MHPDLIALLVDTHRIDFVPEADPQGGIATYSTRERLGLHMPLDTEEGNQKKSAVGVAGLKVESANSL